MNPWLMFWAYALIVYAAWCALLWFAVEFKTRNSILKYEYEENQKELDQAYRRIFELERRGVSS